MKKTEQNPTFSLAPAAKLRHGIYRYKYMYIYTCEVQLELLTFYASANNSKEAVQNVKHLKVENRDHTDISAKAVML